MNDEDRQLLLLLSIYCKKRMFNRKKILLLLATWHAQLGNHDNVQQRKRRWWVRPINQFRLEQGDGNHLIEEMRLSDTEVHFQYTRMTRVVFDELLTKVGPKIEKLATYCREPISARDKLYMTLR